MGLLDALKQYVSDAMPGGLLNAEWTPRNVRNAGEVMSLIPNPVGDVASGLLAVDDMRKGNYGEAALNGLGLLPFVPAMAGITRGEMFADALKKVGGGSWGEYQKSLKKSAMAAYKENKEIFDNAHRAEKLQFESIPVDSISDLAGATSIYKSPVYKGRQSSEYFVGIVNGEPAYIRKSNHWGPFSTNIYEGSQEAIKRGLTNDHFDQYGRVGSISHDWELIGGNAGAKSSQAGFIPLSKLKDKK